MQTFDAKMSETRDMEQFIMDVEEDKDIQDKPAQAPVQQVVVPLANPTPAAGDIVAGSMVTLVSDPSKAGAVIAVDNGKYTVWMDNAPQTFYREQIQLKAPEVTSAHLALSRVRSALTAYQINNPSSSNLYSLNSARIDFVPYQFRPALKMIKADSPRLLVADDVGVGKTIEAGLILKEMEARSSINSVLIICPRPLVAERKWELEMKRFDENFTQLDGKELLECISMVNGRSDTRKRLFHILFSERICLQEPSLQVIRRENRKAYYSSILCLILTLLLWMRLIIYVIQTPGLIKV